MTIPQLRQEARELRPIKRRVSAVCVANLNDPEISGHSIHTFWQNYNPGRYNLSSYLASLVQKAFVASRLGERWAARQSSLLKSVSCRLGRRFRIFLFRTSQSLHRRGSQNEYLTVGHLVRGPIYGITRVCGLVAFREPVGMARF
jgi:hypothetical protein